MAKCFTCGSDVRSPVASCSSCPSVKNGRELGNAIFGGMSMLAETQERGFAELSMELASIASAIEWGFEKVVWELQQQTSILLSINETLKTPTQTQANEWREMAEELMKRGILDQAEDFFKKSLDASPLDYRTYVGIAHICMQTNEFDRAMEYLQNSLPHAPEGSLAQFESALSLSSRVLDIREITLGLQHYSGLASRIRAPKAGDSFDYRSYSYRLMGRIHLCREEYHDAVSALLLALEHSPCYSEAIYDLARYSALAEDTETCLTRLEEIIGIDPAYFYIARRDDFGPAEEEVRELLDRLEGEAFDKAEKSISASELAESALSAAIDAVNGIMDQIEVPLLWYKRVIEKKLDRYLRCRNLLFGTLPWVLETVISFYNATISEDEQPSIVRELELGKELMKRRDYINSLEVSPKVDSFSEFTYKLVSRLVGIQKFYEQISNRFYPPWYLRWLFGLFGMNFPREWYDPAYEEREFGYNHWQAEWFEEWSERFCK